MINNNNNDNGFDLLALLNGGDTRTAEEIAMDDLFEADMAEAKRVADEDAAVELDRTVNRTWYSA